MSIAYDREKRVGVEAVLKAASLCRRVQKELVGSGKGLLEKQDRSPVTVADYGSQAIICKFLKEYFPKDRIVAEENSFLLKKPENKSLLLSTVNYVQNILGGDVSHEQVCDWIDLGDDQPSERFWTIDPIDGTKGFLRGDQYAVALALIIEGRVRIGIMACPNLPYRSKNNITRDNMTSMSDSAMSDSATDKQEAGTIYFALQGEGSWLMSLDGQDSHPIKVSPHSEPGLAHFIESYEAEHSNHNRHQDILNYLKNEVPALRMDSQAKYGLVASGAVDAYMRVTSSKTPDYKEKIWDHAAGSIIVKEAGGEVTDIEGKPLDFSLGKKLIANQGIVATNGRIHQAILEAIKNSNA